MRSFAPSPTAIMQSTLAIPIQIPRIDNLARSLFCARCTIPAAIASRSFILLSKVSYPTRGERHQNCHSPEAFHPVKRRDLGYRWCVPRRWRYSRPSRLPIIGWTPSQSHPTQHQRRGRIHMVKMSTQTAGDRSRVVISP